MKKYPPTSSGTGSAQSAKRVLVSKWSTATIDSSAEDLPSTPRLSVPLLWNLVGILVLAAGCVCAWYGVEGLNDAGPRPPAATKVNFGVLTDWRQNESREQNQARIDTYLKSIVRITVEFKGDDTAQFSVVLPRSLHGAQWILQVVRSDGQKLTPSVPPGQGAAGRRCVLGDGCVDVEGTVASHFSFGGLPVACQGDGVSFGYTDVDPQTPLTTRNLDQVVRFDVHGPMLTKGLADWSRAQFAMPLTPRRGTVVAREDDQDAPGTMSLSYQAPDVQTCLQYAVPNDSNVTDAEPDPMFRSRSAVFWVTDSSSAEPPFFSVRPINEGRTTNLFIVAAGVLFSIVLAIFPVAVPAAFKRMRQRARK